MMELDIKVLNRVSCHTVEVREMHVSCNPTGDVDTLLLPPRLSAHKAAPCSALLTSLQDLRPANALSPLHFLHYVAGQAPIP